jgi:hypothetical protein
VPGGASGHVAAHVVSYEEHVGADLIKQVAKARFRPGRVNDVALAEYAARDPQGPKREVRGKRS